MNTEVIVVRIQNVVVVVMDDYKSASYNILNRVKIQSNKP